MMEKDNYRLDTNNFVFSQIGYVAKVMAHLFDRRNKTETDMAFYVFVYNSTDNFVQWMRDLIKDKAHELGYEVLSYDDPIWKKIDVEELYRHVLP